MNSAGAAALEATRAIFFRIAYHQLGAVGSWQRGGWLWQGSGDGSTWKGLLLGDHHHLAPSPPAKGELTCRQGTEFVFLGYAC